MKMFLRPLVIATTLLNLAFGIYELFQHQYTNAFNNLIIASLFVYIWMDVSVKP